VLVELHAFAFGGRLTLQHVDVLSQWLPTYCFLGKSIAAGHIPAWNPFVMATRISLALPPFLARGAVGVAQWCRDLMRTVRRR